MVGGGRRRSLLPLEEALDFLKILLDRFLAFLQGVDLLLERLQVVGLCEGRKRGEGDDPDHAAEQSQCSFHSERSPFWVMLETAGQPVRMPGTS